MGGLTAAMRRRGRGRSAPTVRTDAPVARIVVAGGRVAGVVARHRARSCGADVVIAATHPKITFLDQLDRSELPADFVDDIERWKTRSGTVKVNVAVDRLPEFTAEARLRPRGARRHDRARPASLDDVEGAFQDAVAGRAAQRAVRRHLHPVGVRPDARARGPARRVDVHAVGAARVVRQAACPPSSTRTPTA